jgi:hypothetical protein
VLLGQYQIRGAKLDSLDLKVMVVTQGVKVGHTVYEKFGPTCRLDPDPETCNCLILPDDTIVHLTDLALHMAYLKKVLSLESLRNLKFAFQLRTPFHLEVSAAGEPVLLHEDEPVTTVRFPPASQFYQQTTHSGLPFRSNAVLQGVDFLSFQCLWACDFAKAGDSCQFCYSGGVFEKLAHQGKPMPPVPTPQDVAEITEFAVRRERSARHIQLTGGSTFNTKAECGRIAEYLNAIDATLGIANIPGEILVYTTPPSDATEVDRVFDAGAGRVACSLEVWDEELAQVITPGKWKFTGRQRHLDCLKYIAKKYGSNRACSSFVVGLEPAESYLAGAADLAAEGIVPIASIWIPFGRPVMGRTKAPGLDYYRRVKEGLAEIYERHGIVPPGSAGLNVCVCRDTWNHRHSLLGRAPAAPCCEPPVRHLTTGERQP